MERTQGTMTETQQQHMYKRQRPILMGPARDSHRPDISRTRGRLAVHARMCMHTVPVWADLFRARFRGGHHRAMRCTDQSRPT